MGTHRAHPAGIEQRDRENWYHLRRLFDDPERAASLLRDATARRDTPGRISSILLDNATVDHAMRYFKDARLERPRAQLPTRPRLMLFAVREFVNAAVLYEDVLTGPERSGGTYGDALLNEAAETVRTTAERLSWTDIFAVLAIAKTTALESAHERGAVDAVGHLLRVPLSEELVLHHLNAITPRSAHMSPHKLRRIVDDDDHYLRTGVTHTLADSRNAVAAIDEADGEGYWSDAEGSSRALPSHPELFAAHLIYRTRVYLLLADLLGCPYNADPLRSELVPPRPRRGFAERVATLVEDAERTHDQRVNEVLGYEAFRVRIPLVLKYVLSRASKPSEVLEIALETRHSRPARRFREYCARVDTAIAEGKRDDVARACAELSAYGISFETALTERQPTTDQTVETAKDLVSIGSPLLGAVIPGLARAAEGASGWRRRRRFAFVEQLTTTPRDINEIEQEFTRLWPHL